MHDGTDNAFRTRQIPACEVPCATNSGTTLHPQSCQTCLTGPAFQLHADMKRACVRWKYEVWRSSRDTMLPAVTDGSVETRAQPVGTRETSWIEKQALSAEASCLGAEGSHF